MEFLESNTEETLSELLAKRVTECNYLIIRIKKEN